MMNEKQDPPLSYLQVIPGRCKDTQTKSERWKKIFYTNSNKKITEVAIQIPDKIYFVKNYCKR